MSARWHRADIVPIVGVVLLAGCAWGPRYQRPAVPLPPQFTAAEPGAFDATRPPPSRLWHSFGDPVLDKLIDDALQRNNTIAQSAALLAEARALRGLDAFALLPTVPASASRTTSKPSSRDPFIPPGIGKTTTYKAGFDASWEIDLFGGLLSARKSAVAEERAAAAGVQTARQSVVAEVAQTYFSLRAEQERRRVQLRNVANLEENQRLLEARLDGGRGTDLDVTRARALYLGTAARVPQTEATINRDVQRLAVLTAQTVDALTAQLEPAKPLPALPDLVTIGTPEQWLHRRPDVQQAEQRLISATAQIGVQAADFFPHVTLLGSYGWTAQLAGNLGTSLASRFSYGPSISWSFLDVGRVRQRVLAQKARAAGAMSAYEDTVRRALEETENGLSGYRAANQSATTLGQAVDAARTATRLAQARFDAGAADTLVVLDAERSQLDLEDQLASAQSQRATALAALYKALVGDFAESESAPTPAPAATPTSAPAAES